MNVHRVVRAHLRCGKPVNVRYGGATLTRRATLASLAAFAVPFRASAADFGSEPITIVVPYPPGGPIDTLARIIAQESAKELKQSFVVENKPGGAGIIGSNAVARSEPDGHTLILGTNQTHATNQSLVKDCPYDAIRDFTPVAGIASMPHVVVARKNLGAADVGQLIVVAEARPGAITFGSAGVASAGHLAGELFKSRTGTDLLHVPFKGLAPMVTELLGERIDLGFAPLPGLVLQQIQSGAIRVLAVASAKRTSQLPAVPTLAEAGVSGVEADAWSALFAPAKTPPAIVERLYQTVAAALSQPSVQSRLEQDGVPVVLRTPREISEMLPLEIQKWAAVMKAANIVQQ